MFSRTSKLLTDPTHDVAAFVVRTILGTVDTGLSSGLAFTKAYAAHQNKAHGDSAVRLKLLTEIAAMLAAEDSSTAAQLVDALGARVGR